MRSLPPARSPDICSRKRASRSISRAEASEPEMPSGPTLPATHARAPEAAMASRASVAALLLIFRVWDSMPKGANFSALAPKELVVRRDAPAARYSVWISEMTAGWVRQSSSKQLPAGVPRSASRVPIAPSPQRTPCFSAVSKSVMIAVQRRREGLATRWTLIANISAAKRAVTPSPAA